MSKTGIIEKGCEFTGTTDEVIQCAKRDAAAHLPAGTVYELRCDLSGAPWRVKRIAWYYRSDLPQAPLFLTAPAADREVFGRVCVGSEPNA